MRALPSEVIMGLKNWIIQKEGVSILFKVLEEKYPEIANLLMRLDESSLIDNLRQFLYEVMSGAFQPPDLRKTINIRDLEEQQKNRELLQKYVLRALSNEPFVNVVVDFLRETGLHELWDIDLEELVVNIGDHGESK